MALRTKKGLYILDSTTGNIRCTESTGQERTRVRADRPAGEAREQELQLAGSR